MAEFKLKQTAEQVQMAVDNALSFGDFATGGDTLTWDGNTEGVELVMGFFYKASDAVPTKEDFANGCTIALRGGTIPSGAISQQLDGNTMQSLFSDDGMCMAGDLGFFITPSDNYEFEIDGEIAVIPEKGVYFVAQGFALCLIIPGYTGFPGVKRLPTKYAPVTKFYINVSESTKYFYTDARCTVKATKSEIKTAVNDGTIVLQAYDGSTVGDVYLSFGYVNLMVNPGYATVVSAVSADGVPTYMNVYTA